MAAIAGRRWFRFSLRSMLVAFTVVAVWLGWNVHVVEQRKAGLDRLRNRHDGGYFITVEHARKQYPNISTSASISTLRSWLGDQAVAMIRFQKGHDDAEIRAAAALFPEADVGVVKPVKVSIITDW